MDSAFFNTENNIRVLQLFTRLCVLGSGSIDLIGDFLNYSYTNIHSEAIYFYISFRMVTEINHVVFNRKIQTRT